MHTRKTKKGSTSGDMRKVTRTMTARIATLTSRTTAVQHVAAIGAPLAIVTFGSAKIAAMTARHVTPIAEAVRTAMSARAMIGAIKEAGLAVTAATTTAIVAMTIANAAIAAVDMTTETAGTAIEIEAAGTTTATPEIEIEAAGMTIVAAGMTTVAAGSAIEIEAAGMTTVVTAVVVIALTLVIAAGRRSCRSRSGLVGQQTHAASVHRQHVTNPLQQRRSSHSATLMVSSGLRVLARRPFKARRAVPSRRRANTGACTWAICLLTSASRRANWVSSSRRRCGNMA